MSDFRDDNGMTDAVAVRFACLELAYRMGAEDAAYAIQEARILADFVFGTNDAAVIAGAKALAATVDGQRG